MNTMAQTVHAVFPYKMWRATFGAECGAGSYVALSAESGRQSQTAAFEHHITN